MKKEAVSEADLGKVFVPWLQKQGYEVYQEVRFGDRRLDIVGVKSGKLHVFELKNTLCLQLLLQCFDSLAYANKVYAVTPPLRTMSACLPMCKKLGIGIISCDASMTQEESVLPLVKVRFDPKALSADTASLRKCLFEEQKTYVGAGSRHGTGWSPWRRTLANLEKYVAGKGHDVLLWDAVKHVEHHYSNQSAAASACNQLICKRLAPNLQVVAKEGRLYVRYTKP